MKFGRKDTAQPAVVQPSAPPVASTGGVSLAKGAAASISLAKGGVQITAHLDWDGGSALRRSRGADLELYVMYVPKGAGRAPGGSELPGWAAYWNNLEASLPGRYAPLIRHHGDSLVPGRETATIVDPGALDYALVCAYSAVSNGVGSFKSYGAKAVVTDGGDQTVTVPLYDDNRNAYWVAIALIDLRGSSAVIRQVEKYSGSGVEARPYLAQDGRILMDQGPTEFKR